MSLKGRTRGRHLSSSRGRPLLLLQSGGIGVREFRFSVADGHESRIAVVKTVLTLYLFIIERPELSGKKIQGGLLFVPCYYHLT